MLRNTDFYNEFNRIERIMDGCFGCGCESYGTVDSNKEEFTLSFSIPGVKKKDVKVTYNNNLLKVTASSYKFSKTVYNVNENKIKAKLEDGILTVVLPFNKEETKTIEVE